MPAQIDQPASSGVKRSWTSRWEASNTAEVGAGLGDDRGDAQEEAEDRIGDDERGYERRQGLGDKELLAANGGAASGWPAC